MGCLEDPVPLTHVITVKPGNELPFRAPLRVGRRCDNVGTATVKLSLPQSTVEVSGTVRTKAEAIAFFSYSSGVQHRFAIESGGVFAGRLPPGEYFGRLLFDYSETATFDVGKIRVRDGMAPMQVECDPAVCVVPEPESEVSEPEESERKRSTGFEFSGRIAFEPPLAKAASNGESFGEIVLRPIDGAPSSHEVSIRVERGLQFSTTDVLPGSYKVIYRSYGWTGWTNGYDEPPPMGTWAFDAPIRITRTTANWTGVVPRRTMHIVLRVNGADMRDNSQVDDNVVKKYNPRGYLGFKDVDGSMYGGTYGRFSLGVTGPVDISTSVIPGQYVPLVASYGVLGHGQLLALGQNVLPTGAISLDPISIEPGNSVLETIFDLPIRKVKVVVENQLIPYGGVAFTGRNESFGWTNQDAPANPTLLYVGCYSAQAGSSVGPNTGAFGAVLGDETLGEVCVPCE